MLQQLVRSLVVVLSSCVKINDYYGRHTVTFMVSSMKAVYIVKALQLFWKVGCSFVTMMPSLEEGNRNKSLPKRVHVYYVTYVLC
jgi:hypothetical protein